MFPRILVYMREIGIQNNSEACIRLNYRGDILSTSWYASFVAFPCDKDLLSAMPFFPAASNPVIIHLSRLPCTKRRLCGHCGGLRETFLLRVKFLRVHCLWKILPMDLSQPVLELGNEAVIRWGQSGFLHCKLWHFRRGWNTVFVSGDFYRT